MQVIIYKFVGGTTNTVEVTEDIYLIHLELLQQEKRNHWKETRRRIPSTDGKHKRITKLQNVYEKNLLCYIDIIANIKRKAKQNA